MNKVMIYMMQGIQAKRKQGILLVNLGTPESPTIPAIKRFLSQFLHDQRVVDLNPWLWRPLLKMVILPKRVPKVAKLYQSIWMEKGSPLAVYSKRQAQALSAALNVPVALGMTYGAPSVLSGMQSLLAEGVEDVMVLPLYPQYSGTTTGAAFDALAIAMKSIPTMPHLRFVRDYHDHPLYIEALACRVRQSWQESGQGDYLLCSYHGIPQRYADQGDCYPEECHRTTQLLGKALGLPDERIGLSFQSVFGREEWVKPYTDLYLTDLRSQGIERIDVIGPSFSVDCLETLEEIAQQYRAQFLQAGGVQFNYIPCLNDSPPHIELMKALFVH